MWRCGTLRPVSRGGDACSEMRCAKPGVKAVWAPEALGWRTVGSPTGPLLRSPWTRGYGLAKGDRTVDLWQTRPGGGRVRLRPTVRPPLPQPWRSRAATHVGS